MRRFRARARNRQIDILVKHAEARYVGLENVRYRYAIDFAIDGDLRYIAHNDTVRLFARASARARLPVCFTQGFNPRARVAIAFPRPVGQASDVERLLIDLTEEVDRTWLIDALQARMPAGAVLKRAIVWPASVSCRPRWVRYRVKCPGVCAKSVLPSITDLLDSERLEVTRVRHRDARSCVVDIRPFVDTITVADEAVFVSVHVTESGSAAPVEVCRLLGMEACAANHCVRRVEIRWHDEEQHDPKTNTTT